MKSKSTRLYVATVVLILTGLLGTLEVSKAADVPQSFTLDGRLFSDAAGTTLLDS